MRVALLMGGKSGEHDISLRSGAEVAKALDALGHVRLEVTFARQGGARWRGADATGAGTVGEALVAIERWRPDVTFLAMHGADGEDGRLQGALELLGLAYHGSGVQASANGLDKVLTKTLFKHAGLPVARDVAVEPTDHADWDAIVADLGLPLVLKTEASGSSVGVELVRDREALGRRGEAMRAGTPRLLIEQYVAGRELTGAVLERADGTPEALPIVLIQPKSAEFFDFEAKYTPGATDEICPAPIDEALEQRLRALAVRAHVALRCAGYSRTDFIVTPAGDPILLETNTLPGLTPESLFPKAAREAGLSFEAMIARLLDRAR